MVEKRTVNVGEVNDSFGAENEFQFDTNKSA